MVAHKVGILRYRPPAWPLLRFDTIIFAQLWVSHCVKIAFPCQKKFFYLKLIFKFCASKNKRAFSRMGVEHSSSPQTLIICSL